MADIDDELLALAGDASSDEDDAPMNISRDTTGSPGGRGRDTSTKASNGRKVTAKKSGRPGNQDDSEEEGEA
jgi:RNA polymerase-associated protein RTF1